jgi:hypothetical protein
VVVDFAAPQWQGRAVENIAVASCVFLDADNSAGCTDGHGHPPKTDQRGMPRPDKEDTGGCDIGAYESQSD